ncbi:MAG: hypothetical protein ACJAVK_001754 [Akkermansiaceae bacterium]|jgi:hypothetical protein
MMRDGFPAEGLASGWRWVGLEDRGMLGSLIIWGNSATLSRALKEWATQNFL